MNEKRARNERKATKKAQIIERLKNYTSDKGYSIKEITYVDFLKNQRECLNEAKTKKPTTVKKYEVKNYLIEISLYFFNSLYFSQINNIKLTMPKKRHKPPNSFMANFGIVSSGKNKNVELRKITWDQDNNRLSRLIEKSFSQSDPDLFGNKTIYTDQFEKTFAEIEGKAAEVFSNFIVQDERKNIENSLDKILSGEDDTREIVAKNILDTTNILYSKLILALYFSIIQAKLWLPGNENSKSLESYLFNQLIKRSMDLLSRKWIWVVTEDEEDIPFFDKILIEIPEYDSIFISISRRIGLYICPPSHNLGSKPFRYIPHDDVSLSHDFLEIIGYKINTYLKNTKNSAIYFSPLAVKLATHPEVPLSRKQENII